MSKRWGVLSPAAAVLAVLLPACEQTVIATVPAATVNVAPATAFVKVTESTTLSVTVLSREGATLAGRDVEWSSLSPDIATVDETGVVRGVKPGSAIIRAVAEGVVGSANVTVTSGPAIAVALDTVQITAVHNSTAPGDRTVNVANAGDGTLDGLSAAIEYAEGEPTGWLTANLPATAPATLVLSASQATLALGTYTATVKVASPVASNSPVAVTVRMQVVPPPAAIALGSTSVSFTAAQSGAEPAPQSIGVTNAGGASLSGLTTSISYGSGQPGGWLTASLSSTTAPASLTLRASPGALAQGTYTASVSVAAAVAQNSPQTVSVTFTVGPSLPLIALSPSTLGFSAPKGSGNPAGQTVQISNSGAATIDDLTIAVTYPGGQPAGWLTTSLSGTSAPATLTVAAVTGALDVGTYTATISVSSATAANSPQQIGVTFQVQPPPPALAVAPTSASFTTSRPQGDPSPVHVDVTNAGSGSLTGLSTSIGYGAGQPTGWLAASLAATTAPTTLTLAAQLGSLGAGVYRATVRVSSTTANPPVDIDVTFTVAASIPAAPGSTAASPVSDRRIDLTWNDLSNDEGRFDVERSTNGGTSWTPLATTPANSTGFADTGLTPSTTYSYRVRACNTIGCSVPSPVAVATTAPAAPTGLSATAISSTRVDLQWTDASTDETGFAIERSANGGQTWAGAGTAPADATSFTDASVAASTSYRYRIRACRGGACSAYSNDAQVTTPAVVPVAPSAPGGAVATVTSTSSIQVSWTAATGVVDWYRVQRSVGGPGAFALLDSVPGGSLAFQNGGLTPGTAYYYRVQACNAVGCSGFSNDASATIPVPVAVPGTPGTVTANASAASRIDVSWGGASGTVGWYIVERQNDTQQSGFALADSTAGTSHQSNGLQPLTTYSFRVKACNSAGCSGYSNTATATTPVLTLANAPTNVSASAVSAAQINVNWVHDGLLLVSRFELQRASDAAPGVFSPLGSTANGAARSFSDSGLIGGTTYQYQVRACNLTGCSAWVGASATTPAPATPAGVGATANSSSQITVGWQASAGATSYQIRRRVGGSGQPVILTVSNPGVTSYTDAGLTSGTSYSYEVRACGANNVCSGYSGTVSATTH